MILLRSGEPVLLRVVPVDPRDMFRGDYVTLSYEFSRIPPKGIAGLTFERRRLQGFVGGQDCLCDARARGGRQTLASGNVQYRTAHRRQVHPRHVGRMGNIEFGIESFYVEEGQGKQYEQAVRDRKLSADVVVTSDGQAALRGLQYPPRRASRIPRRGPPTTRRTRTVSPPTRPIAPSACRRQIKLDGRLDEPEWSRANVERHFTFPWKKAETPATEFMAFCDDQYLYFAFHAEDADIVVLDKLRDKEDIMFEDRVEIFFSRDPQMHDYFGLEIDSRGRVFDYRAKYYRQFDVKWHCEGH